ncbi:peptidoglycan recognition protein family protein [Flaviflexus ciconiae]|nr:N-acetylmuramoyl-L-alanine amidase [Flaviflexus ciconiae]
MARTMKPISEWTVWDPVTGRSNVPIRPRMMTIHTAVTNSPDIYGPGLGPGRTHSHFYNPKSGKMRQHQEINRKAFADGDGNNYCVSVEHWDGYPNGAPGYWKHGSDVPPLTDSQIENDARLFAHLVKHFNLPNRIATPNNLTGLGWHRLGIKGNWRPYNPADLKTWTGNQSGVKFSNAFGKACPGDRRIDQIREIYARAQEYLTPTKPAPKPKPTPKEEKDFLMALTDNEQRELLRLARTGKDDDVKIKTAIQRLEAEVAEIKAELTDIDANTVGGKVWRTNAAMGRAEKARLEAEAAEPEEGTND